YLNLCEIAKTGRQIPFFYNHPPTQKLPGGRKFGEKRSRKHRCKQFAILVCAIFARAIAKRTEGMTMR
ncbi:hypothetical protein, partial [Dolichospermum circinale]|uniref:hypothetical protein n=1 Tax=Dolichospermum circinale TaxID=109265 RepID=UPI001E506FD8